jgi:hypothetical protein
MYGLFIMLASVLLTGAIMCLILAIRDKAEHTFDRSSWRWLGASVVLLAASVGVFITLAAPAGSKLAFEAAQDFARATFREQVGREPDTIHLQDTPSAPYTGTARAGEDVWDVVVTRSGPQGPRGWTIIMECTLTPRGK